MPQITLQCETRRALKIAVFLREIEYVLELIVEGHMPEEERTREAMGRRQEQCLYLARTLEAAVKDQSPELPAHQRPKERHSKTVWCSRSGCRRTLAADERKISTVCVVCRLEDEKKIAAAK